MRRIICFVFIIVFCLSGCSAHIEYTDSEELISDVYSQPLSSTDIAGSAYANSVADSVAEPAADSDSTVDYIIDCYKEYIDYSLGENNWQVISKQTKSRLYCSCQFFKPMDEFHFDHIIPYTELEIEYKDINNNPQKIIINDCDSMIDEFYGTETRAMNDQYFSKQILDFAKKQIISQMIGEINSDGELVKDFSETVKKDDNPDKEYAYIYINQIALSSAQHTKLYEGIINKENGLRLQNLSIESLFPSRSMYISAVVKVNDNTAEYNAIIDKIMDKIKTKIKLPVNILFSVRIGEDSSNNVKDRAFIQNEEIYSDGGNSALYSVFIESFWLKSNYKN